MQKRENVWRSAILKHFRTECPAGFIWAHDAHFRHGFPDLTIILPPWGREIHVELKVCDTGEEHLKGVSPRQIVTLQNIARAGGTSLVWTLIPSQGLVLWYDMRTKGTRIMTKDQFEKILVTPFKFSEVLGNNLRLASQTPRGVGDRSQPSGSLDPT